MWEIIEIWLRFMDTVGLDRLSAINSKIIFGSRNIHASLLEDQGDAEGPNCTPTLSVLTGLVSLTPPRPGPCLGNSHRTLTSKSLDGIKALLWGEPATSSL